MNHSTTSSHFSQSAGQYVKEITTLRKFTSDAGVSVTLSTVVMYIFQCGAYRELDVTWIDQI